MFLYLIIRNYILFVMCSLQEWDVISICWKYIKGWILRLGSHGRPHELYKTLTILDYFWIKKSCFYLILSSYISWKRESTVNNIIEKLRELVEMVILPIYWYIFKYRWNRRENFIDLSIYASKKYQNIVFSDS